MIATLALGAMSGVYALTRRGAILPPLRRVQGTLLHRLPLRSAVDRASISPDGGAISLSTKSEPNSVLWRKERPDRSSPLRGTVWIGSAWSPNGQYFSLLDSEGVFVYRRDTSTAAPWWSIPSPGLPNAPASLSWSPDSAWLAIATMADVTLYEGASGRKLTHWPLPWQGLSDPTMAYSPGGQKLLLVGWSRLHVVEAATGGVDLKVDQPASPVALAQATWSPDGRWIACRELSDDNSPTSTRVYDAQTCRQIRQLICEGDNAVSEWSPSGSLLLISADKVWGVTDQRTLAVVDVTSGQFVAQLDADAPRRWVAARWVSSPPQVVALSDHGELWRWEAPSHSAR